MFEFPPLPCVRRHHRHSHHRPGPQHRQYVGRDSLVVFSWHPLEECILSSSATLLLVGIEYCVEKHVHSTSCRVRNSAFVGPRCGETVPAGFARAALPHNTCAFLHAVAPRDGTARLWVYCCLRDAHSQCTIAHPHPHTYTHTHTQNTCARVNRCVPGRHCTALGLWDTAEPDRAVRYTGPRHQPLQYCQHRRTLRHTRREKCV